MDSKHIYCRKLTPRWLISLALIVGVLVPSLSMGTGMAQAGTDTESGHSLDSSYSFGVVVGNVDDDGVLDAFAEHDGADEMWLNQSAASMSSCGVSGLIVTDTIWSPSECDPYVVTGNLSVQSGVTLTIQAGTTVKFNSSTVLAVAGTLVARGTEANPITLTSNQMTPAKGNWGYIHFAFSSTDATFDGDGNYIGGCIIQYALIEYAGGVSTSENGALRIEESAPFIDHSTMRDNKDVGIYAWTYAAPRISYNTITSNSGDGIHLDGYGCLVTITGNTISSNSGDGIHYDGHVSTATISGNTIDGNSRGIYVDAFVSTAVITGNIITDNSASNGGGIYVNDGAATIDGNIITDNSASNGGGIYVNGPNPTVQNNIIRDNAASRVNKGGGIYLSDGSIPTIHNNNLYGNMTGDPANTPNDLYNGNRFGGSDVDAENNWWGTTDPDVIEDHIWHFMDDPSLSFVDYTPYLTSPVGTPSVGTFEPNGGWGRVGQWADFTTTYSDCNGYEDITWAFFFLDRAPPIASGGLAAAYIQSWDLLLLLGGGFCRPGQPMSLSTAYVTLDCGSSSVSGEGETLTINWHARPERCFEGGCGWNYAVEFVADSSGRQDAGLVGWWRLSPPVGAAQETGPVVEPAEADLERLRKEIEAWQSQLDERYLIQR